MPTPPDAQAAREADAAALVADAAAMAVVLELRAALKLLDFARLLLRWNRVHNLTAITAPEQVRTQHLLDSLSIVAPMRRHAAGRAPRVLDVGSGGGLPGAVLAIAQPGWPVHCIDAVAKKTRFVQQVAIELGVRNLQASHARIETLSAWSADIVVSRAFASLADFARLTGRQVQGGAVWLAMKGRQPTDEIAHLPPGIEAFHVEPLAVPRLDAERCAVWMRRS